MLFGEEAGIWVEIQIKDRDWSFKQIGEFSNNFV